ncbi:MAG: phosphonoacetaldehyde reductase [Prevotellaceae bacterium]|nr:phosphonoacetaldehyde reductase [Prevotellaceae bacterium]
MVDQEILTAASNYAALDARLRADGVKRLLLVCGKSIEHLALWPYFQALPQRLGIAVERFSAFSPNPTYESALAGVRQYRQTHCDAIVAVGGGSAMDVAKCIKLYSSMPEGCDYINQPIEPNNIRLIAVPTTAGTGSEATRYAIINYRGEKYSVTHDSCIPSVVLFDPSALSTLPLYQRQVTMLDALCHAIESYWSVNSNAQSQSYAQEAIRQIFANLDAYLRNDSEGNAGMLAASNIAGKAINITQTTAGHAMSYKLTGLYGLAHGHAVALCVDALWPYMLANLDQCTDPRGESHLRDIFARIASAMGCPTPEAAMQKFRQLVSSFSLERPKATGQDHDILKVSVNPGRLKNHPVRLDESTISALYHQILR